jgi:uncharacterized protein (DUF58 family)
MFRHYNMIAPTREGWVYLALVAGVMFGAVNTGNNLVYIVLGVLLAMLVVANVLAEWNLRELSVERRLPPEVFAGIAAAGSFVLHNRRGRGTAWAVELEERGPVTGRAVVERTEAGCSAEVAVDWHFPTRGRTAIHAIRVSSSFPFGLVRRWRDLHVPAEVLVYPEPVSRHLPPTPIGEGDAPTSRGRTAEEGDFAGLRAWRPGDPLRRVHWPTSARTPTPMVALRVAEGTEEIRLELDARLAGEPREEAIRRIAGRAEIHLQRGDAVGLRADGDDLAPRVGSTWRRRILTALALLEAR